MGGSLKGGGDLGCCVMGAGGCVTGVGGSEGVTGGDPGLADLGQNDMGLSG